MYESLTESLMGVFRKLQEKIRKDELMITDFYALLQRLKKMGPLKSIMKMIPG